MTSRWCMLMSDTLHIWGVLQVLHSAVSVSHVMGQYLSWMSQTDMAVKMHECLQQRSCIIMQDISWCAALQHDHFVCRKCQPWWHLWDQSHVYRMEHIVSFCQGPVAHAKKVGLSTISWHIVGQSFCLECTNSCCRSQRVRQSWVTLTRLYTK